LKLTEEFDLTFPVPKEQLNIVPCLLTEKEPYIQWDDLSGQEENSKSKIKTFMAIYSFAYIPAGLFNRVQVRLYQYSDNSVIWKRGSVLRKNDHKALIKQTENSTIEVKVQGVKPENVVFLIHEVIETLINESFKNIKYEYSFPCPDCIDAQVADPCLFSSNLLRRAHELKAPFLQCNAFFHAVSIQDMLAIVPIDGLSNYVDLNLEYSLRDLKTLKSNLKYDITYWYCQADVAKFDKTKSVNPLDLLAAIEKENYTIWSLKDPKEQKMDQVTLAIKQSKLVVLCISDAFAKDEKSMVVFDLVKNIIKKNYLIVELGHNGDHHWLADERLASVCTDFRIIMQDPNRYPIKLAEMFDNIESILKDTKIDKSLKQKPPDVFISYCWQNSHDAIKKGTKGPKSALGWLDPRILMTFFKENGIEAWLDIQEINPSQTLFAEITKGINQAKIVVACLSDEYVKSINCKLEFRFAHTSLKVPIVKAVVGTGQEWRKNEISFLSGSYPEINFQYENPGLNCSVLNFNANFLLLKMLPSFVKQKL
jgi:leucine-rich repeat kinase 2